MSKNSYCIRVNSGADIGMGHVVRTSHIARELERRGARVLYVIDHWHDALDLYLNQFSVIALYDGCTNYSDEESDAFLCVEHLDDSTIVILDDYRFSSSWETIIKTNVDKVVVIDDMADRSHVCDLLIDQRWAGSKTQQRYDGLVPEYCELLLGPDYALLNPVYEDIATNSLRGSGNSFSITLSLGGGGDMKWLAGVVSYLSRSLNQPNIDFSVVVGPAAQNLQALNPLVVSDSRVKLIQGLDCLAEVFARTHLFIGAAGTSLYELNCTETPALTFPLADNQDNEREDLESLGHYFHIPISEMDKCNDVSRFVAAVIDNYDRVTTLCTECSIRVDGKGIARLVDKLMSFDASGSLSPGIGTSDHNLIAIEPTAKGDFNSLSGEIHVSEVNDGDINAYLDARNLLQNRDNMTETSEISRIGHYSWWFSNKRCSFRVNRGREPLLYIWHQLGEYKDNQYLIGGWFVCSSDCGFDVASLALKWQLDMTTESHPYVPWVAVIAKENRFVNLLNRYMGFTSITAMEKLEAVSHFFPHANREHFNYVELSNGPL